MDGLVLRRLTVKDHGKFVALQRRSVFTLYEKVERLFKHGFLLLLLVSHKVDLFLTVAVIICSRSILSGSIKKKIIIRSEFVQNRVNKWLLIG